MNESENLPGLRGPERGDPPPDWYTRPVLLDLFCGDGGCSVGYARAGFRVVGVDLEPHPNYPFEFIQADALEAIAGMDASDGFDAIHASPPCQHYVQFGNLNAERWGNRVEHPDLIPPVRELLEATGLPWVIENVVGAPLRQPLMLCGTMFGLGVRRHRLFESNLPWAMTPPRGCSHDGSELAVYGKLDGRRVWTRTDGSEVRAARTLPQAQAAMGIDWMEWDALKEAIPPAYTEWIGGFLIGAVEVAA